MLILIITVNYQIAIHALVSFSFYKKEIFYFCHLRKLTPGCPQFPLCTAILWEIKANNFYVFFVIFFDINHFLAVSAIKFGSLK